MMEWFTLKVSLNYKNKRYLIKSLFCFNLRSRDFLIINLMSIFNQRIQSLLEMINPNSKFFGACDRFRSRSERNEESWKLMMGSKVEVSELEFLDNIDIFEVLDPDESWDDYKSTLDEIRFYRSDNFWFFQTQGFEFIFDKI